MISSNEILKSNFFDYKVIVFNDNIKSAVGGAGKKKVFIAMADKQTKPLMEFLEKVFQSVHINLHEDTHFVEIPEGSKFWFSQVANKIEIEKAFFFGVTPVQAGLNLDLKKYKPVLLSGVNYLMADAVETIQKTQSLKKELWESMKSVFN
jgi:hypothetical protein